VVRALALAMLSSAVLVAGACAWASSDGGRAYLASKLSAVLSRELRGELRVGRIHELTPWRVRVADVEATDATGVRVAYVAAATASVDARALLAGAVVLDTLDIQGAQVSLREVDGQLALAECFLSAQPAEPSAQASGFRFETRRGRLAHGQVHDLPGGFVLRNVQGAFSLAYGDAFRMRAQAVSGQGVSAQGSVELALRELALKLAAGESSQLHAQLRAGADTLDVDAAMAWSAHGPGATRARLWGRVGRSGLAALGQHALASALRDSVGLDLEAALDLERPRLVASGTLRAAAGQLALRAECTRQACQLGARSERLVLGQIIEADGLEPLGFDFELGLSGESLRTYELRVQAARYGALALPPFSAGGDWSQEGISVRQLQVPRWIAEPHALKVDLRATRAGSVAGSVSVGLARFAAEPGWGRYAGLRARQLLLQASGDYRAATGALSLSLALSASELEHDAGRMDQLRVEAEASGTLREPKLSLRAQVSGVQVKTVRVDTAQIELRGGPARYALAARLRAGAVAGQLSLALARQKSRARVSGKARVDGLLATPLQLSLGETTISGDQVRLSALEASTGPASLALSGLVHFSRASDLLLRARGVCAQQLAQLGLALPSWAASLRGCATAQLHAMGTMADPGLSGALQVTDLELGEHALGHAEATLELQRGSRHTTLGIALDGPLASVVGELEGQLSELGAQGFQVARGYRGRLLAKADAERLAPLLELDPAALRGFALSLELLADDQALRAELDLQQAGTTLLRAHAHGRASPFVVQSAPHVLEDLAVEIELQRLPLRLFTQQPILSSGRVDGVIRLQDLLTPAGNGGLRLELTGMQAGDTELSAFTILGQADGAGLHVTARAAQRGRLELSADVPWRWEGRTRLVLQEAGVRCAARLAGVPLALLLAPAANIEEVHGSVSGAVSLTGLHEQLSLEGALTLKQGSFTVQDPFMRFDRVDFALGFERNMVRLRALELTDQAGTLKGQGELQLAGLHPKAGRLTLSARQLPVRHEGIAVGAVSGKLAAEAQFGKGPARVHVRLRELAVQLPEHLDSVQPLDPHADIVYVDRAAPAARTSAAAGAQSTEVTPLEVELDASEPFWVRRPNLAVELSAKLRFQRDASGVRVLGVVTVERGLLTLLGRGFDLQRGTLDFEGGREIDPAINLDAVHKLGDGHTVTASVRGTLSSPTLNFTSSVPGVKTNAEALQLLASGRDASAAETAQAQVGAALAGLTAGMFGKITGGKYGKYIPVLSLEAGASAGTRMRAGVQADDVIPKALQDVVKGAYVEGYVGRKNQGGSRTGAGGVLMELYFPHKLVTGGTWELPNNWALEVTWEP
jgi:hypothetical protein